jgi:Tfp pilus assembly protein PilE
LPQSSKLELFDQNKSETENMQNIYKNALLQLQNIDQKYKLMIDLKKENSELLKKLQDYENSDQKKTCINCKRVIDIGTDNVSLSFAPKNFSNCDRRCATTTLRKSGTSAVEAAGRMNTIFAAIGVTSAAQAAKLISMCMLTNFLGKILQEILEKILQERQLLWDSGCCWSCV